MGPGWRLVTTRHDRVFRYAGALPSDDEDGIEAVTLQMDRVGISLVALLLNSGNLQVSGRNGLCPVVPGRALPLPAPPARQKIDVPIEFDTTWIRLIY